MSIQKVKRNDPCPCGSGKKYKQCCMKKDQAPRRQRAALAHQLATQQEMTTELAEDFAAYETTFDEIEAATEAMDAYRPEFERTLKDPQAIAHHSKMLFSEDRFETYRYTAADVRRAGEASAYVEPPSQENADYVQFLNIATAYLADRKSRLRIATELLQMIPDYVAAERYMDAWLIQFCAYHLAETPDEANPFLAQMLENGLHAWQAEVATR